MDPANVLPGQQKVSIEQAFRLALEHHAAGRRQQAEALVSQINRNEPRHAHAWQLAAILAHEAGNTVRGIELLGKAIQANPMIGQFYANRGEMHRIAGNLPAAVADGEQAVKLDPRLPAAHSNLGIACYHQGEIGRAEACQKQALALDPNCLSALNNLGSICRDRKDREGAVAMYRKVLALRPDFVESANNLGAVLTEMEDPEEGIKVLVDVIRKRPNYAEAHCNIGNAFMALENYPKAEIAFANAARLQANYAEAIEGLARCLQEQRKLAEAEAQALKAAELKPGRAATWSLLGGIYSEQSFADKAMTAYEKAIAIDPRLVSAWIGKGHMQMENGKMADAEASFRQALAIDPQSIAPRLSLTQVCKTKEDDENFLALMEKAKDIENIPETRQISLHFAVGKALDDLKRYDEAFPHFLEGCRLKRKRVDYSPENNQLIAQNICDTFTPELLARLRGGGSDSKLPIFVLGMPRSGTTLTETIIASHPDVFGAGELPDLLQVAGRGHGRTELGYPLNLKDATPDDLTKMANEYVRRVQERAPGSPRITDKMPSNYLATGLIHLMLPNAKIVHIKRNAVDTCLSQFTRLFNRSQHQSYDLRELGKYYRSYLQVMAHWRQVLPAGSFYEIQYEQLVANQEAESRKLIEFCGLPWDDACLSPDKTERHVKTASVTQVRQPVYTSSVERWRVYEKFLGPLLEELGDAVKS